MAQQTFKPVPRAVHDLPHVALGTPRSAFEPGGLTAEKVPIKELDPIGGSDVGKAAGGGDHGFDRQLGGETAKNMLHLRQMPRFVVEDGELTIRTDLDPVGARPNAHGELTLADHELALKLGRDAPDGTATPLFLVDEPLRDPTKTRPPDRQNVRLLGTALEQGSPDAEENVERLLRQTVRVGDGEAMQGFMDDLAAFGAAGIGVELL